MKVFKASEVLWEAVVQKQASKQKNPNKNNSKNFFPYKKCFCLLGLCEVHASTHELIFNENTWISLHPKALIAIVEVAKFSNLSFPLVEESSIYLESLELFTLLGLLLIPTDGNKK